MQIDVEWGEKELLAMDNAFCTAMLKAGYHVPADKLRWPQSIGLRISTRLQWSQHGLQKFYTGCMRQIIKQVADKHCISVEEIKSHRRSRNVVNARHEAFYRCRHETSNSLPQIGRFFGGRDHSTVLHGIRKHQERLNDRA